MPSRSILDTTPQLMGILNVTPDSFWDQGRWKNTSDAIQRGIEIYQQGADIIDVGGESTRPGAEPVPLEEELKRVIPVIQALVNEIPIPLSIDTMKPEVAEAAIEAGASMINDVTGFRNPLMRKLAVSTGVKICVMHMHETPKTMQQAPFYPEGIAAFLLDWFSQQADILLNLGIKASQLILDPGIGFGKTVDDNLEILHNLPKFRSLGFPILVGLSRKSFLSKILQKPTSELLPMTMVANAIAIQQGADIIRVHDIVEHEEVLRLIKSLRKENES